MAEARAARNARLKALSLTRSNSPRRRSKHVRHTQCAGRRCHRPGYAPALRPPQTPAMTPPSPPCPHATPAEEEGSGPAVPPTAAQAAPFVPMYSQMRDISSRSRKPLLWSSAACCCCACRAWSAAAERGLRRAGGGFPAWAGSYRSTTGGANLASQLPLPPSEGGALGRCAPPAADVVGRWGETPASPRPRLGA